MPHGPAELVLYAEPEVAQEFPAELFFDDDVNWHRQQLGRVGQVGTVNLLADGDDLYAYVHQSDLVQRISRRREHKTRVENRFKGWHHLLLNAVANVARERGARRILSPASELAMRMTDRKRSVQTELFERLYDRDIRTRFLASRQGEWWSIDMADNGDRILLAQRSHDVLAGDKAICVCHDIERGYGHRQVDPWLARAADRDAPTALAGMLKAEQRAGVRSSYFVVGEILAEVRKEIESAEHCLAFHSYDHQVDKPAEAGWLRRWWGSLAPKPDPNRFLDQLSRCRTVDYRIKGYRPARSHLTAEMSAANLCFYNFEWLASSARSFGHREPEMRGGIARLPILFDDFAMYKQRAPYADWERKAMQKIADAHTAVFSLHDCYAYAWLPHYERFLDRVRVLGTLKTLDQVAAEQIMRSAL